MAQVSLAALRTEARNRCDMRTVGIFSDADFNAAINSSIQELYDLVVQAYEGNYFVTSAVVPLTGGIASYPLPTDHYKLLGVDWQPASGSQWQALGTFEFKNRNKVANAPLAFTNCHTTARYCFQGSSLWILPAPQDGHQIQVWYVPQAPKLVADTDSAEFQNGWQEFVVLGAGIKALVAEESDASPLLVQQQQIRQRIQDMAPNRDVTEPHRMVFCDRPDDWSWWC